MLRVSHLGTMFTFYGFETSDTGELEAKIVIVEKKSIKAMARLLDKPTARWWSA